MNQQGAEHQHETQCEKHPGEGSYIELSSENLGISRKLHAWVSSVDDMDSCTILMISADAFSISSTMEFTLLTK